MVLLVFSHYHYSCIMSCSKSLTTRSIVLHALAYISTPNRLFLGNVQVQMLKNWIQKHPPPPPPVETNEKHQQTMDEQEIINDNSSHDQPHHPPKPVLPVFVSSSPSHLNRHSQISQYSGIEANSSTATVSASTVYSGMNRHNNNHY